MLLLFGVEEAMSRKERIAIASAIALVEYYCARKQRGNENKQLRIGGRVGFGNAPAGLFVFPFSALLITCVEMNLMGRRVE